MNAESPRNDDHTVLADSGSAKPPANLRIDGYEIIRELHHGGQGVVFEAIQKSTKRKVAIKVLLEGAAAPPTALKRFDREVELIAQLKHPNIITVFDSGVSQDGRRYYVMDYVQGQPLNRYVREEKLDFEEALKLFAKVCEAVQYAHQRGVIHRDLKPSNILVETGGTPKVLDFGLAKLLSSPLETLISLTGQLVGTVPYMSPEQVRGKPDEIDARSDVYALGVILYQMLTGQYPYPVAGDLGEILHHIKSSPPTPPSRNWTPQSGVARKHAGRFRMGQCPIDRELQTIVMQALAKEPERRYQSAGNLAEDVGRYLRQEPVQAKRDSILYSLRKLLWRRRWAMVVVASVVIASVITGVSLVHARSEYYRAAFNEAQLLAFEDPETALSQYSALIAARPRWIEPRIKRAYLLRRENERDKAIEETEQILAEHQDCGEAHLLMAQIFAQGDQREKAERHRAFGERLLPDDKFHRALAFDRSESVLAIRYLDKVLLKNGSHFEARLERAWRHADVGNFEEMLKDAEFLIGLRAQTGIGWNVKGVALNRLGRHAEAIRSFTEAIRLSPRHLPTYLNRASGYLLMNKFDDALADTNHVLDAKPQFAGAYAMRGLIYFKRDELENAEADCRQALALSPNLVEAVRTLAKIHKQRGEFESAEKLLLQAYALGRPPIELLLELGDIRRLLKRWPEAIEHYSEVLRVDRANVRAAFSRGLALLDAGKPKEAVADFSAVIKANPESASAFLNRGEAYRRLGEYVNSLEDCQKAASMSNDPAILRSYGVALWLTGSADKAIEQLDLSLDKNAKDPFFVNLWIWELRTRLARPIDTVAAQEAMARARRLASSTRENAIVRFLESCTNGDCAAHDTLGYQAESPSEPCEWYYYMGIGESVQLSPNKENANRNFKLALETQQTDRIEYHLALSHLGAQRQ